MYRTKRGKGRGAKEKGIGFRNPTDGKKEQNRRRCEQARSWNGQSVWVENVPFNAAAVLQAGNIFFLLSLRLHSVARF